MSTISLPKLVLLLCLAICASQALAIRPVPAQPQWGPMPFWPWGPFWFPAPSPPVQGNPPVAPSPPAAPAPPAKGAVTLPPYETAQCWAHAPEVIQCVQEIMNDVFTHNIGIGSACCNAIKDVSADCLNQDIQNFTNPFLVPLVKDHFSH